MSAESSLAPPVQPLLWPPSLRAPCVSRSCWHTCDHQGSSCVIILLADSLSQAEQPCLVVACRCSLLASVCLALAWSVPAHAPTVRQVKRCRTSSASTSRCKVGWVAVTVLCCRGALIHRVLPSVQLRGAGNALSHRRASCQVCKSCGDGGCAGQARSSAESCRMSGAEAPVQAAAPPWRADLLRAHPPLARAHSNKHLRLYQCQCTGSG